MRRETERHLDEGGRLVQRHLSRGNVQPQPGRFLPLQAAGALAPWFSHVPCRTLGLPAAEVEESVSLIKRTGGKRRCSEQFGVSTSKKGIS